jgi:hypothetical protein
MHPSPAELRSLAVLRDLALKKGFILEPCTTWGCWRLIGTGSKPARSAGGALAFSKAEAKAFLERKRNMRTNKPLAPYPLAPAV